MSKEKVNKIANFKCLFENKNEETPNSASVKLQRSASKLNIPNIFQTKPVLSEEDNSNTENPVKPKNEVIEISTKALTEDKVKLMKNMFEKKSKSNLNLTEENITDDNNENDDKSENKVKLLKNKPNSQQINEDTNIVVKPENETVKIYKPKVTGDKIKLFKDTFERSSTTISNQLETTENETHSAFMDNEKEENMVKNNRKSQLIEDFNKNEADNFKSKNESVLIIPQKTTEDKVRLIMSKFEKFETEGNKIDIEPVLNKEVENVENKQKLKLSTERSTIEDTQHVRKEEDMNTRPGKIGEEKVRNIKNKFEMGFSAEKSNQNEEDIKKEILKTQPINDDVNPDIKSAAKPIQDTIEVSTNEITEDQMKVIKNKFEKCSPPSISIQNDQISNDVTNLSSKCDDKNTEESKNKLNFPVLRKLNLNDPPTKKTEKPDDNFDLSPRKLKSTKLIERSISQNYDFTKPNEVKFQRSPKDDSRIILQKVKNPETRNNAIVFDFTKRDSPKGEMKSPIGNMESKKLSLDKNELVRDVNENGIDEMIESSKNAEDNKSEIPLIDIDDKDAYENFDFNESQIVTKEISNSSPNKVPVPSVRTKFFTKNEISTISSEEKLPDL